MKTACCCHTNKHIQSSSEGKKSTFLNSDSPDPWWVLGGWDKPIDLCLQSKRICISSRVAGKTDLCRTKWKKSKEKQTEWNWSVAVAWKSKHSSFVWRKAFLSSFFLSWTHCLQNRAEESSVWAPTFPPGDAWHGCKTLAAGFVHGEKLLAKWFSVPKAGDTSLWI